MQNPVSWFEIYVSDLEKSMLFYETVLCKKLTLMQSPMPHLQLAAFPAEKTSYGASGALVKMQGFQPHGNGTIVYFECDDCAIEESRVTSAGGQVEHSKMSIGEYGWICHFQDIDGNLIGLHSMS